MCIASFVSSVLWLACGFLLRDPWVWVPNLCGVAVGAAQLGTMSYVYVTERIKQE